MINTRISAHVAAGVVTVLCGVWAPTGHAQTADYCGQSADNLLEACRAAVEDDDDVGEAICVNITNRAARKTCFDNLTAAEQEGLQTCDDQHEGRDAACDVLGTGRYDPDFSPAKFDDPRRPSKPNAYFPLDVGKHWEYRSLTQVDKVDVVDETKLIAGVNCIVVRDQVFENGLIHEATDDWYVPAKDGSVWYFGEEVKDYEVFPGDKPQRPQLVKIDGSFKAGDNGDKPGVIMLGTPKAGAVYLEEFSLANAEDVTEILSATYAFGQDATLDDNVPWELAHRFCADGKCVVTKNYSLLEPGLFARKYYARGVGTILEVESTGEVIQLVNCNFDKRCAGLPTP